MATEFSTKQPAEEYAISFDFTAKLGTENIASAVITAIDQSDSSDVSLTVLKLANQTNTTKIVYGWVRAGTSGHDYLITCTITGDGTPASIYELEGVLPVVETPTSVSSSGGGTRCVTEPTLEPVTLAELRTALGIDSGTMATDSTLYTSIAAGSHGVVTAYTLLGTAIDVLGHTTVVYLNPVNNGASGTVDVKIQECDTLAGSYTDWATGAFTQVTEANDTTIQEKAYTGAKKYIRTVAKTLVAACEFGTSIMVWEPNVSDDDLLNELITAGRISVENDTGKRIMQQTWDYCPKHWPSEDRIKLPFGNLISVTSVKWKDTAGTETTLVENTDYVVVLNGTQCGFVGLLYGGSWPSGTLYPHNPITIQYVCGYATQAEVPISIKQAVKRQCVNLYANRGDDVVGQQVTYDKTYERLCNLVGRLHDMDFDL
jgi:uncharacterized phiE125 gp8 family phage protein